MNLVESEPKIIIMKLNIIAAIFSISLVFGTSSYAQKTDPLYPDMTIVSEKLSDGEHIYVFKRWEQTIHLTLTFTDQTVSISIKDAEEGVLGLGKMGKDGLEASKLILRRSVKGMTPFWQFAIDRIQIENGTFKLVPLLEEGSKLWTCQMCAYETYLMDVIAEEEKYAQEQLAAGVLPAKWKRFFEFDKSLNWIKYKDVVEACMKGGECSDYVW